MFRFTVFCLCLGAVWSLSPLKQHSKLYKPEIKQPRIINGVGAKEGQFPWQVALIVVGANTTSWFCGGTIISENWVLTSGNCVHDAYYAMANTGSTSWEQGRLNIGGDVIIHEAFHSNPLANDIGLVKFSVPIEMDETTAPIAIADDPLEDGVTVRVSGYRDLANSTTTFGLHYVDLVTIPNSQCNEIYGIIQNEMACANSDTDQIKSICYGDAGGPVITNPDENPLLVGISSFLGEGGCETGAPTGITRVASFRNWIREKTGV